MKWADDHHRHPLTKRFKALNKSEEDVLTRDGRFHDIIEDWADLVKHGHTSSAPAPVEETAAAQAATSSATGIAATGEGR